MVEVDPNNEDTFITCVIESRQEAALAPKQAILKDVEACGYGSESTFAIRLALEEAIANAMNHGNKNDPTKTITLKYAVGTEKAVFIIRDEGPGFDPQVVPDCRTPERLSLPCGRGIMLIRAYMDEVRYRDNGRELYLAKENRENTQDA